MAYQDAIRFWSARSLQAEELGYIGFDSPISLAAIKSARRPLRDAELATVPAIKFVFGQGEPSSPFATKLNGAVWRPADRPWPLDAEDQPAGFFMQFNFGEAADFLYDLPGDVLQIYAMVSQPIVGKRRPGWSPDYENCGFVFEWIDSHDPTLVRHDDASMGAVFPTCYSMSVRTHDYIDFETVICLLTQPLRTSLPEHEWHCREFLGSVARLTGNKIGGLPLWVGTPPEEIEGRFLCCFHGVSIAYDCEYPWLNRREPISVLESIDDENLFGFGDGRLMQVFLDERGKVRCFTEGM